MQEDGIRKRRGISLYVRNVWLPVISAPTFVRDLNVIHITIGKCDSPIHLFATYGDSEQKSDYWRRFSGWFKARNLRQDSRCLILGDLNVTCDFQLDRNSTVDDSHCREFLNFVNDERFPLHDSWRLRQREFSWVKHYCDPEKIPRVVPMSRIDFALSSTKLEDTVVSCDIIDAGVPLSLDHSPVEILVLRQESLSRIPGRDAAVPMNSVEHLNCSSLMGDDNVSRYQGKFA